MKYVTARQCWHDSFSAGFSNDPLFAFLEGVVPGTSHDTDARHWHEVLAGKIQSAVSNLPPHLLAWGHLCFSPDNIRNPRTFRNVHQTWYFVQCADALWQQFQQTETYDGTKSTEQSILCRMAVEHVMHLEQNGNQKFFSENDCRFRLNKSRHEFRKEGYQATWHVLTELLKDWTGWTLEPVAKVIDAFKEKQEAACQA